ncbi:hypothetical protein D3C81_1343440 [compost metagenome]
MDKEEQDHNQEVLSGLDLTSRYGHLLKIQYREVAGFIGFMHVQFITVVNV